MRLPDFFDKANVFPIIRAHIETLSSFRTGRPRLADLSLFFGLPVASGVALVYLRFGYRVDAVNGFLNAFAILTGLLLNLLILVFTISLTLSDRADAQVRRRVLREVFVNVCFCIIVAIAATATALVSLSYMRSAPFAETGRASTFLLSFLTINFVLSLLMILKRMYKLIASEFDVSGKNGKKAA